MGIFSQTCNKGRVVLEILFYQWLSYSYLYLNQRHEKMMLGIEIQQKYSCIGWDPNKILHDPVVGSQEILLKIQF